MSFNPIHHIRRASSVVRAVSGGNRRRIGVVGFGMSGKTVFLTSLINHLLYHDPEAFDLGGMKIVDAGPRDAQRWGQWPTFPYGEYRGELSHQRIWPQRTLDRAQYDLEFSVQGEPLPYSLTLYDIPGERVADITMHGADFAAWSEKQLTIMREFARQQSDDTAVERYVELAEGEPTDSPQEVVDAYKDAMIVMAERHCINISPSCFLMDETGKRFREKTAEGRDSGFVDMPSLRQWLRERCSSGLQDGQFAPLGKKWLKNANHETVRLFSRNYGQYKQKIVTPVFGTLISCDALGILVDIPHIIQYGRERDLNDYGSLFRNVLLGLKPDASLLPWLMTLGFRRRIQRIAVIASQCDRFHDADWPALKQLTDDLAIDLKRHNLNFTLETFICSAVRSAVRSPADPEKLRSFPKVNSYRDHTPFRIPEAWGGKWPGDGHWNITDEMSRLLFRIEPNYPMRNQHVPAHENLDDIFRFLTGW